MLNKSQTKRLFLTGYEKESISGFLGKLRKNKITTVIDVREIPLSRKNGFSQKNLYKELSENEIKYYHFVGLGSPNILRKRLRDTGDYLNFFKDYRKYIKNKGSLVNKVIKLVINNGKNSALLCFEKYTDLCHRSIIASEILKTEENIRITPL